MCLYSQSVCESEHLRTRNAMKTIVWRNACEIGQMMPQRLPRIHMPFNPARKTKEEKQRRWKQGKS